MFKTIVDVLLNSQHIIASTPTVKLTVTERSLDILLVEDNAINQTTAKRQLKISGHTVTTANNGKEGIEAWENGNCDMILMDIQCRSWTVSRRHKPSAPASADQAPTFR